MQIQAACRKWYALIDFILLFLKIIRKDQKCQPDSANRTKSIGSRVSFDDPARNVNIIPATITFLK